ncbi:SpaA isopeptide-forming pilin-related protein [Terribacillus saccharophilus]|uniref:SpaA isopeptide-forming pilin-related protein n=1 Tax=Terribacillus saccharophilus TaxID=361277 RepID=UPI00398291AE
MIKKIPVMMLITIMLMQTILSGTLGTAQVFAEGTDTEPFQATVELTDKEDNAVSAENSLDRDADLKLKVNWNKDQHTSDHTYNITLPDQLTYTTIEPTALLDAEQVEVGTYELADGILSFRFTNEEQKPSSGKLEVKAQIEQALRNGTEQETNLSFYVENKEQVVPLYLKPAPVEGQPPEEGATEPEQEELTGEEQEETVPAKPVTEAEQPVDKEEAKEEPEADKSEEQAEPAADETKEAEQDQDQEQDQKQDQEQTEENTEAANEEANEEVAAENRQTGEIEENIITNIVLKDKEGNIIDANENPDNHPSLGDEVSLDMEWALADGHPYGEGSTFTFSLPDYFAIYNDVDGQLEFGDESVGTYHLSMDGTVVMTFNDNITKLSNVKGTLHFWTEFHERIEGSIEQEITFNIKEEDIAVIPVRFQPKPGNAIDKSGKTDRGYNAKEITWTVDFNKQLQTIENAVLKDPLEENQQLQTDSIKVYELDVQLDGSVKPGELVDPSAYTVQDEPFEINFGKLTDAYRVEFKTDITDADGTAYKNTATLTGSNIEDLPATASVNVSRGKPLAKRSVTYDAAKQTIKWEVQYNYNEKTIQQQDAVLTDLFDDKHMLIKDSIKVEKVTIGENGQQTKAEPYSNYTVNEQPAADGKRGFQLQFNEDIQNAYKITYETKADGRVMDDGRINNSVIVGENQSDTGQGVSQQILSKWHSNVNYKDKTANWTIDFNKDSHLMKDVVITDTYPNKGLTMQEDTFKIVDRATNKTLSEDDYELAVTADGFTVKFKNEIKTPYRITYTTDFDYDSLGEQKQFRNHVVLDWKDESGKDQTKEAAAGFNPDNYTVNNGFKNGSYNAVSKEITWNVGVNYDLKDLQNITVTDYIQGKQNLVDGSLKVYEVELTGGNNGVKKGAPLQEGTDYTVGAVENDKGEPGFKVNILKDNSKPYWIEYKTSLAGELIVNRYDNTATLTSDGRDPIDLKAQVSVANGGSYNEKDGSQNGNVINWKIDINKGQSHVSKAKVTDEQQSNQILLEDSFKLYETNVAENGSLSKGEEVPKDAYELDIRTADDGSQTFELSFLDDIDRAYILEYQSYINAANGEKISNKAVFSGENITTETVESGKTIVVRKSGGSGTGSGEYGSLEVSKVDAATGEALAGATFTLYDSEGKVAIRSVTTGEDGKAVFKNLLYDDYLLKEDKAPFGYVVGIQDTQKVTVDGESKTTIKNKEITRDVILTKSDKETKEALQGAVFKLEQQVDGEWKQIQENLTTDENGVISVKDLEAGNYRFIETAAPDVYELNADPVYFDIKADQTYVTTVTKDNAVKKGSVKLQKTDEAGNPLQGAVFTLKDEAGKVIKEGLTSDGNGLVEVHDLRPGNYEIVETKAPEFYQLDGSVHKFTIDPVKQAEINLGKVQNKLVTGGIELTKVDADQRDTLLAGAVFELQTADGKVLKQGLTTNEAGVLVVDQLAPGDYQLIETKAPNDYQLDQTPITFTIEKSNEASIQVEREMSNKLQPGEVVLTKVDDKDASVLADAVFSLYKENGELVHEGLKTDTAGQLTVSDLQPGSYYFQETQAPANYELNETKLPFTIERSQVEAVQVKADNTLTPGAVSLIKTDSDDGNLRLAGAEFKLQNAKGETVKENLVTNEEGRIIVEDLAPGKYYFMETKAPEHYELNDTPIEVTVEKGQQEAAVVNATNKLIPGSVVLEKIDSADHGITLEGAAFKLVNSKGDVVEEKLVTDKDGRITVNDLKPGDYQFIEIEAPADYELDAEPIDFTVEKSQQEALVIQQTNTLKPGAVQLVKVNKHDTAEVLAGAEYVLKDASGNVVKENLVTDQEGKISVTGLAPGTYQFVEVKAPADFVLDETPITVEIERSQEKAVTVTAVNELIRGAIEITKVGEDDLEKGLEGAVYELRTKAGEIVQTGTTDETGKLRFNELLPGDYEIVEANAPFGYDLDTTPIPVTVERSQEEVVTVQQVDQLTTGSVLLKKVDSKESTIGLSGAVFELQDETGKTLQEGLTTNEAGELSITDLKPGDYQLVETKAPADYTLNGTPIIFTIEKGQQVIPTVEAENTLTPGAVSLIKLDKDNENVPLQGAEYKLVDRSGTDVQTNLVTDQDGRIIVSDLAPGKYQFIETKAPENYVLDATPIDVEVTRSQQEAAVVYAENELIAGSIVLEKKDSADDSITLAGAEFKLVDGKGNVVEEKLTTDENGRIVVENLKPGAYQFIETKAPTDYVLDEKPIDFEIAKSQKEPLIITADNTLTPGSVELIKVNAHDNSEKLSGAVFELQDQDGKVIKENLTTDEAGKITVDNLAPGSYRFVETKAPVDFLKDDAPISFIIERSQTEKVLLTAENDLKKGSLEIVKVDSEDPSALLEGAAFDLWTAAGEKIASGKTDKEGKLSFRDLVPGNYIIKETEAPFGYDLNTASKQVTIERSQQETAVIQLTNELSTGAVMLEKVDAKDNNVSLAGAVFRLLDSEGKTLQENLTTNDDGQLTISDLKPGDYQLVETSAPENYVLDDTPINFTIEKGQQTPISVTAGNTLQPGVVSLIKVDKDNPEAYLENAEFRLLDSDGNTVKEKLYTDSEGRIIVEDLAPGSYTFVETKAPIGYELDDAPISVTVEKGQKEAAVVTAVNELTTGTAVLEKVDADDKDLKLEGAVFKLVNDKGDTVKEELITDENGRISVDGLKPGNYQFIETKAPAGYELDDTPINVTVEKAQQEAAVVTAVNELTPGKAVLEKVDADDNTLKLKGAVFKLVNDKGDTVKEELITDENGRISVDGLKPGNYQFIETKAPAGYELNETPIDVTVEKGQQEAAVVTAVNELTPGSAVLEKVDADNSALKLEGAVFKLLNDNGDTVKEELTTDENGRISVDGLKPGNYQFIETKAPAGYELNDTPIDVTVKKAQQEAAVVTAENAVTLGTVILHKVDADDESQVLEGAVFKLVNENGDSVREELVTDKDGRITVEDLKPGNYQFIETKAPAGYELNTAPIDVTVEQSQKEAAVVTAVNELTPGSVILEKVDAEEHAILLEGAVFKLVNSKGDTVKEELTTDKHGRVTVEGLKPGNYQFIETKAPAGYELNDTPIDVTVEKAQKQPTVTTVENELTRGSVVLEKADADDSSIMLEGAQFKLVDSKGNTVKEKLTTDRNGRISVEDLKPGDYQFVETQAPAGYTLNDQPIDVTVEKGQQQAAVVKAVNALTPGSVVLEKVDADDSAILLEDAAFKLVNEQGEIVKEALTTDKNGRISIDGLKPGNYQFIETKAPAGYDLDETPIDVTVEKGQQQVAVVTAVNKLTTGKVILKKVDAADSSVSLKDAEFKLVDAEGETVKEALVTDEAGQITVVGLKPGNYQFIETKAPAGYELDDTPINVTVEKAQQEAAVVTAVNELTPGTAVLEKVDADDNTLKLKGAVFKLVNDKGATVKEELITDENGRISVDGLKPGNYQFIETKAPAGYELNETPIDVTVEKGQQEAAIVTAVNELTPGTAVLEKVDADDNSKVLKDAVFNLIDEKGNMVKENLITDENGQIIVDGLKPGDYQFVETKAPAGYQLDQTPITFTIETAQTAPAELTVTNKLEPEPTKEEPNEPEEPVNGETPKDPSSPEPVDGGSDRPEPVVDAGTVKPEPGKSVVPAVGSGTDGKPAAGNQPGLPASLPQTGEQLLSLMLMAGILSAGIGGVFIWNAFRTQTARKRK